MNSAFVTLTFSKPLEVRRVQKNRFSWAHHLDIDAATKELFEKPKICNWDFRLWLGRQEGTCVTYFIDLSDHTVTTTDASLEILYSDKMKALPDTDPCSVSEASKFIEKVAALMKGEKI